MDSGDQAYPSALHQVMHTFAQLPTSRQGIALTPAKELLNVWSAYGPGDPGRRVLRCDCRQVKQDVKRGVATADHQDPATGIPCSQLPSYIRDAIENGITERAFSQRKRSIRSQRIGLFIGAGGIDDGASQKIILLTLFGLDPHHKWSLLPASGLHFVKALTGHAEHARLQRQMWLHLRDAAKRNKILFHQFSPGGIPLSIWSVPALLCQQRHRSAINHIAPG